MAGRRPAGWSGRERTREYDKKVGLPGDVARVRIVTVGPTVIAYTGQYEPWIEEAYRPVARYGSAHGRPHLDLLDWHGRVVEKRWLAMKPLEDALNDALSALDRDWPIWREVFLRRRPG